MLSLIFLAGSVNVVVSTGIYDCVDKEDNFQFLQGCNECWCENGKATCTNKGCTYANGDDNDDNIDEDVDGDVRNENAIGIHAWDLEHEFPKKEEKRRKKKTTSVTPYPPSFHHRFNLQQPILEKEPQRYPPGLVHIHPDAGGLNVLPDAEVIQQQYPKYGQYQQFPQYASYLPYQIYNYALPLDRKFNANLLNANYRRHIRHLHRNASLFNHRHTKR